MTDLDDLQSSIVEWSDELVPVQVDHVAFVRVAKNGTEWVDDDDAVGSWSFFLAVNQIDQLGAKAYRDVLVYPRSTIRAGSVRQSQYSLSHDIQLNFGGPSFN